MSGALFFGLFHRKRLFPTDQNRPKSTKYEMSFENQIKEILKARLEGTATEEELAILREWLERSPQNRELLDLLEESTDSLPLLGRIYGYDEQRVWGNIRKAARKRRIQALAGTVRKYAAAAAALALLAGGSWWALDRRAGQLAQQAYIEQVVPGVRGAVLTLSSGENVALEEGGQRMLVEQDGTRIEIGGDELAYHKEEAEEEIAMTNTVTVPRGKEFSLRLSDGTQVWLNSESSLVFPVRFGDGPREVTVTGEAYFDVAHDAARQFVVHADTVSVSVYGTAFNLSAYADEGVIETTLVRGSVEVRSGRRHAMLEPGQQARVGREGAVFDVHPVAAEDYAAWTRGLFTFNEEPLASICRKLSRWYGVEIVPQGAEAGQMRYTGIVKRYETFAEMARLLERTNQIRAEVRDEKIVLCIDRDDS